MAKTKIAYYTGFYRVWWDMLQSLSKILQFTHFFSPKFRTQKIQKALGRRVWCLILTFSSQVFFVRTDARKVLANLCKAVLLVVMKEQNSATDAREIRLSAIQTLLCEGRIIQLGDLDDALTPRLDHADWVRLVDRVLVAERQRITDRYPGVDAKRCVFRGQVWRVSSGGLNYTWEEAEDDIDVPPHALPIVLFVDITTGKHRMHPGLAAAADVSLPGRIEHENPDPKSSVLQKIQHWRETAMQYLENAASSAALNQAMEEMHNTPSHTEGARAAYETAKRLWLAQQKSADKTRKNPKAHAIAIELLLVCDELKSLLYSSSKSDDEWLMMVNGAVQAARWHDELLLVGRRGIRKQNAKLLHRRGRN